MPIGSSSGEYFADDSALIVDQGKRLNVYRGEAPKTEEARLGSAPFSGKYPNSLDSRDQNIINPERKGQDILTRDQNIYTSESMADIGTSKIHGVPDREDISATMPARGPGEAADALKQREGSQVAQNSSKQDYDMDAWKKATGLESLPEGQHYPDTYKLPNHMTFSDDSIYHGQGGNQGGHWGGNEEQGWTFTPGRTNLEHHSMDELKDYFARVEPNAKLLPPDIKDVQPSFAEDIFGKGEHDVRPAISEFLGQVKNAFKLPGDVFAGKVQPGSQQEIERAADLAGLMVAGPAPVAKKMADGTLGSFAGVKSSTVNHHDLGLANALESMGADKDLIHQETGFHRGIEGKWKYEIDDSKAKLDTTWADNPTSFEKQEGYRVRWLPKVLEHPDLYEAYPRLKDTLIKYDNKYEANGAQWNKVKNLITVGKGAHNNIGTIMHEVQHAIQDIEDFAKGGAPGVPESGAVEEGGHYLKYGVAHPAYQRARADQARFWKEVNKKFKEKGVMGPSEEDMQKMHEINKFNNTYDKYVQAAREQSLANYLRLGGEAESRNTAARVHMTAEERRASPPYLSPSEGGTLDIGTEAQIRNMKPSWGTAYGAWDPETNLNMKSVPDLEQHLQSPERAKFRLGQLLRDKADTKKAGGDVEGSDYMHYNTQIRKLREYLKSQ